MLLLATGCAALGGTIEGDIKEQHNAFVNTPGSGGAGPGHRFDNLRIESVSCRESDALDRAPYVDAAHTCELKFDDGSHGTICALSRGSRRYNGLIPASCEQAAADGWGRSG